MRRILFKIGVIVAFMVMMLTVFCISAGAFEPCMPDGASIVEYMYPADECNRTINVTCLDPEGNVLKKVQVETKHGEDEWFTIYLYDYRLVKFSSDQGLWETCKLSHFSGGSHYWGVLEVQYYFRTALSQKTLNITTVWEPFDEITVREHHYKMYRIGRNQSIRDDKLTDESRTVLYCGDYYSTRAMDYTGWTLSSNYSSGFSGNWSMSWIGSCKNIASLNECMQWDVIWYTDEIKEERPDFNEYDEEVDGNLTYIENRIVTITYYYAPDWCVYTFDANGGTGGPTETVEQWYDHEASIPTGVPTRSGRTFLGWGTTADDTTPEYQPGETIMMRTTKTLYAIWSAPSEYLVEYDANGGQGAPGSQVKIHDVDLTLRTRKPRLARHTFLGWGTSASDTTPDYQPGGTYSANASVKLYAIWEKDNYEFSISNLSLSASEVFQSETVKVSVRTDSWDRKNAYYDIPVALYIDGTWMATQYVDFSAYGVSNVSFNINVGTVTGAREIEVRINWDMRGYETNPNNNSIKTTLKVKRDDYVLGIQVLTGNEKYKEGTEVITSYLISNASERDILPTTGADAVFSVYYYSGSHKIEVTNQVWENVVIPMGKVNLVYFKWRVPAGTSGKTLYCVCGINTDGALKEYNLTDNSATLATVIASLPTSQTVNPGYADREPTGYSAVSPPSTQAGSASWTMWVYENGAFVEKKYGIKVTLSDPSILPGANCSSAEYNIYWTMKSGYGVKIAYTPSLVTLGGCLAPEMKAYTGIQSVYATFPENRYQTTTGKFRTLYLVNNRWQFVENTGASDLERLHFIPVWLDDGQYIVAVTASEIWTPAGMIRAVRHSNPINLNGSIYDDWYQG